MFTEFFVSNTEWDAATQYFQKNHDAIKYRRADSNLEHSFMRIGDQLIALANKKDPIQYLGEGGFSKVKLVKNQANDYFALKIKKNSHHDHLEDSTEWALLTAMKRFYGTVTRISHSINSFFQRHTIKTRSFFNFLKKIFKKKKELTKRYTLEKLNKGETLRDALKSGKYKGADEALILAYKITEAVQDLHETYQHVHCDLKPSNIMVSGRGADITVDLIDFGFSKKISAEGFALSSAKQGTRNYIAMESFNPYNSINIYSKLSDVYSLGITFGVIRRSILGSKTGKDIKIHGFLSPHLWPRERSPYQLDFNEAMKRMAFFEAAERPLPRKICELILLQIQTLKKRKKYNTVMINQFLESIAASDAPKPSFIVSQDPTTESPLEPKPDITNSASAPKYTL